LAVTSVKLRLRVIIAAHFFQNGVILGREFKMKNRSSIVLASIAVCLLVSGTAAAEAIYTFSGKITQSILLDPSLVGQSFAYTLTVNDAIPDTNPDPTYGEYLGAVTGMSLSIGPDLSTLAQYATATGGNVVVQNDSIDNTNDWVRDEFQAQFHYSFTSFTNLGFPNATLHSSGVYLIQQESFTNPPGPTVFPAVFTSDALPLFAFNLADFDESHIFVLNLDLNTGEPGHLQGNIASFAFSTAVPEPTSILLLGTGLGVLWLAVGRRRK
jgi:hypothetical protein